MISAQVHGRIHICTLEHLCILDGDILLALLRVQRSHNVAAGAYHIGIHIVDVPRSEGIRFPHVFTATLAVSQIHVPSEHHLPECDCVISRVAEGIRALENFAGDAAVVHQAVRMIVVGLEPITEPLPASSSDQGLAQVLSMALATLMIACFVVSEGRHWGLLLDAPVDGGRDVGDAAQF